MSISNFYNKTVSTKRLTDIGGSSKRQDYQTNLASVACAIHPVNPDLVAVQGSAFYNNYKMFCASGVDIDIGDRIIDGSDTYEVSGKSSYDDYGTNQHTKLTLVKGK